MKRQYTMQRPYDGVRSNKEISRLKRELTETKQRLKSVTLQSNKSVNPEFKHIKDVLSAIVKASPEPKSRRSKMPSRHSKVLGSLTDDLKNITLKHSDSEDSDSRIYF